MPQAQAGPRLEPAVLRRLAAGAQAAAVAQAAAPRAAAVARAAAPARRPVREAVPAAPEHHAAVNVRRARLRAGLRLMRAGRFSACPRNLIRRAAHAQGWERYQMRRKLVDAA